MVGFCKNAPKDEEWLLEELKEIIGKSVVVSDVAEDGQVLVRVKRKEGANQIIAKMKEAGWVSPVEHKEALSRELAAGYRLAVDFTKGGE